MIGIRCRALGIGNCLRFKSLGFMVFLECLMFTVKSLGFMGLFRDTLISGSCGFSVVAVFTNLVIQAIKH